MRTAAIVILALLCLILIVDLLSLERGMRRAARQIRAQMEGKSTVRVTVPCPNVAAEELFRTINDLLEQLVGDLDEDASLPQELPPIQKLDANTWRVRGSAPLEDVAAQLGVSLPVEDYDTFSGYVFNLLGMIPRDGSTPEVQDGGLTIKISQIKGHRLESAVVCRAEPAPVQEAAARA